MQKLAALGISGDFLYIGLELLHLRGMKLPTQVFHCIANNMKCRKLNMLTIAALFQPCSCLRIGNLDSLAIAEIAQTVNRFSVAVDTHDFVLLQSVFSQNAVAHFGPETQPLHGLQKIETALRATLNKTISQHTLSTQTVTFIDNQSALATSYLQGTFFGTGELVGQTHTTYGRYVDLG